MTKERLAELLAISITDLTMGQRTEILEYYKHIYGSKGCNSCKDKFTQYHRKLSESGVRLMTVKEGNFKLRDNIGVLQINFGNGLFISPSNSDDELCVEFLKVNPNRISLFEKYPA